MRKIGLIIDSASGISEKEANERGHGFIPLQILVNGESKKAGVDIHLEELWDVMEDKKNVELKTSLPNGDCIEKAFKWALERYEKVIYIGLSHKLSGTQNAVKTVSLLEEEYKNRIYIYQSTYSSPWLNLYLDDFEKILEQEDDFEKLKNILDKAHEYMYGILSPGDIYWFYKGGRISKSAYMAGSLLKVTPILTLEDGTLDKDNVIKARGVSKAMDKMTEIIKDKVNYLNEKGIPFKFICMDSNEHWYKEDMVKRVKEVYGVGDESIVTARISTEQTAHMGPGSCGVGIFVSLFDLMDK